MLREESIGADVTTALPVVVVELLTAVRVGDAASEPLEKPPLLLPPLPLALLDARFRQLYLRMPQRIRRPRYALTLRRKVLA